MIQITPGVAPGLQYLDWYKDMRDNQPVYRDPETGSWNVFRYQDVAAVLTDHRTFGSDFAKFAPDSPQNSFGAGNIVGMDPPRHHRLRSLVSQAFTPRAIAELEPRIHGLTEELLDKTQGRKQLELVSDLSYPLPVIVIAEMLGVPAEDRPRFKIWADSLLNLETINPEDAAAEASLAKFFQFREYLSEHIQAHRAESRNDLLSGLIAAEIEGQRLSDEEIAGFATILLVAGHVTTTSLLSGAILCLSEHPEAEVELRADPAAIPMAIEEVLRYRAPATRVERVATTETQLGGQLIRPGEEVDVWLSSANHDEREFGNPEEFDIKRHPNPHLSFAKGIHFCLGAPLARLEARVVLGILLQRYSRLQIDQSRPLVPYSSPLFNSVQELHVLAEPRV